jgi:hypothetical protein
MIAAIGKRPASQAGYEGLISFAHSIIPAGIPIAGAYVKIGLRVLLAALVIVSVILTIEHRENDAKRYQEQMAVRKALSDALEIALPGSPF